MAQPSIRVEPSLREFAKDLRKIDKELPKEIRRTNKSAADLVSTDARSLAGGYGQMQRRAAKTIHPRAETWRSVVEIRATKAVPFALVAFLGKKGRTGWYAAARYKASGRQQHRPWIGNQWEVGSGKGPLAIDPAFRRNEDRIVELYEDMTDRLTQHLAGFSGEG